MTADEYRDALRRLDLTQVRAALLFGVNERTSRSWACDQNDVPSGIAILLKLLCAGIITIADIEEVKAQGLDSRRA